MYFNLLFLNFSLTAQRFAMMNMKAVIAELVLNFDSSSAEGFEYVQLSKMPGLLRQKEGTVQIMLKKRN